MLTGCNKWLKEVVKVMLNFDVKLKIQSEKGIRYDKRNQKKELGYRWDEF